MFDEVELLQRPITGVWRVEGLEDDVPGVLTFEAGDLVLTLLVVDLPHDGYQAAPQVVRYLEPPHRPTITGVTNKGNITLLNCARREITQVNRFPRREIELKLTPNEAVIANSDFDIREKFKGVSFRVNGLHDVLNTQKSMMYILRDVSDSDLSEEYQRIRNDLRGATDADSAILFRGGRSPKVEVSVDGKLYVIIFHTGSMSSMSLTQGDEYRTSNSIHISSDGSSISELKRVAMEVRNFLGVFCMCQISTDRLMFGQDDPRFSALSLWQLGRPVGGCGEERSPFEVWCKLGERPDVTERALKIWFEGGDQRRLARWLLYDGLSNEPLTTSRFLAAAQIWEILGRELHTGAERPTFRVCVNNCLNVMPWSVKSRLIDGADALSNNVVRVRNALTHMRSGSGLSLDEASTLKGDLTLKLLAGACVIEAHLLKLPLDRFDWVMRKNNLAAMAAWDISV